MSIYKELVDALNNSEANEHGWKAAKIEKDGTTYSVSKNYQGIRFCVGGKRISKAKLEEV